MHVTLAEIRAAYEYFYVKDMPEGMPYEMALEFLLKEIGLNRLMKFWRKEVV